MNIIKFKKTELTLEELRELLQYAEAQKYADRDIDTDILIDGDYAKIKVKTDSDGDMTIY